MTKGPHNEAFYQIMVLTIIAPHTHAHARTDDVYEIHELRSPLMNNELLSFSFLLPLTTESEFTFIPLHVCVPLNQGTALFPLGFFVVFFFFHFT